MGHWRTWQPEQGRISFNLFLTPPGPGRRLHADLYAIAQWGSRICVSPVFFPGLHSLCKPQFSSTRSHPHYRLEGLEGLSFLICDAQ